MSRKASDIRATFPNYASGPYDVGIFAYFFHQIRAHAEKQPDLLSLHEQVLLIENAISVLYLYNELPSASKSVRRLRRRDLMDITTPHEIIHLISVHGFSLANVPVTITDLALSIKNEIHFKTWMSLAQNRKMMRELPLLQNIYFFAPLEQDSVPTTHQICYPVDSMVRRKCQLCRKVELNVADILPMLPRHFRNARRVLTQLLPCHLLLKECPCHEAYYCSPECQRKHWPTHKSEHQAQKAEEKSECQVTGLSTSVNEQGLRILTVDVAVRADLMPVSISAWNRLAQGPDE